MLLAPILYEMGCIVVCFEQANCKPHRLGREISRISRFKPLNWAPCVAGTRVVCIVEMSRAGKRAREDAQRSTIALWDAVKLCSHRARPCEAVTASYARLTRHSRRFTLGAFFSNGARHGRVSGRSKTLIGAQLRSGMRGSC